MSGMGKQRRWRWWPRTFSPGVPQWLHKPLQLAAGIGYPVFFLGGLLGLDFETVRVASAVFVFGICLPVALLAMAFDARYDWQHRHEHRAARAAQNALPRPPRQPWSNKPYRLPSVWLDADGNRIPPPWEREGAATADRNEP